MNARRGAALDAGKNKSRKPAHAIAIQQARIAAKKARRAIGRAARSPFSSAVRHRTPELAHKQKKAGQQAPPPPANHGPLLHSTRFFRDHAQMQEFARLLSQRGRARTHIWSAGCSTGEEPYSLAILASQIFGGIKEAHERISITATDIDATIMGFSPPAQKKGKRQAEPGPALRGEYNAVKIALDFELFFSDAGPGFSARVIPRYFNQLSATRVLKAALRSLVRFQQGDIVESAPIDMKSGAQMKFDMVFCNNVLRYFNIEKNGPKDLESAVSVLTGALNEGGYLFLDHETDLLVRGFVAKVQGMERISGVVESNGGVERIVGPVIYQKKAEP
jgi:chemotaxis methyl-accepting protein methylase